MLYSKRSLKALCFLSTSVVLASSIHHSAAHAQEDVEYPGLPGVAVQADPCLGFGGIPQPCPPLAPGEADTCTHRGWMRTFTDYGRHVVRRERTIQSVERDGWQTTLPCDCRYVRWDDVRTCGGLQTLRSRETQVCWTFGVKLTADVSLGLLTSLVSDLSLGVELNSSRQSCVKLTEAVTTTVLASQCFTNKYRFVYDKRKVVGGIYKICRYSTWLDQNNQLQVTEEGGTYVGSLEVVYTTNTTLQYAPLNCEGVTIPYPDPCEGERSEPCTQRVKGCHVFQGDATCGTWGSH